MRNNIKRDKRFAKINVHDSSTISILQIYRYG